VSVKRWAEIGQVGPIMCGVVKAAILAVRYRADCHFGSMGTITHRPVGSRATLSDLPGPRVRVALGPNRNRTSDNEHARGLGSHAR
jgi:hypothetical protein